MDKMGKLTDARISLGRTGTGIPHREALAFKLAHACARDAVFTTLDVETLREMISHFGLPLLQLRSRADDRNQYLQRPDLGRMPCSSSEEQLKDFAADGYDVSITLADGLSSEAVMKHSPPLLDILVPLLRSAGLSLAPLVICEQARVAIADTVGYMLKARLSIILIGERPGLSSPQSMGAYLTWQPAPGLNDSSRNCISNIRPEGLLYEEACIKLFYLIKESFRRKLSGVQLKDETGSFLKK